MRAEFIPTSRLSDLLQRPNPELYAYSLQGHLGETARVVKYASRRALESFCKPNSVHHALLKVPTHPNMMTNRNTQRESR
jgi:hypothetical protein